MFNSLSMDRNLIRVICRAQELKLAHGDKRFSRAVEMAKSSVHGIKYFLDKSDAELGLKPNRGLIE